MDNALIQKYIKKIEQYRALITNRDTELDDVYIIGIYPLSITLVNTKDMIGQASKFYYDLKDFPMEVSRETADTILLATSNSITLKHFRRYEVREWYNYHILNLLSMIQSAQNYGE